MRRSERRLRRPVAVLVSRFPAVTETFILREVDEMERQGQSVLLVPLLKDDPPVIHPRTAKWVDRVLHTPFLSGAIATANLRALRRDPRSYLAVLALVTTRTVSSWNLLVRTLALFPKAVYLADRLQTKGICHVHAHFATHPSTVALVVSRLSGIEFSMTAHAHDIFVRHQLLGEKLHAARFVRVISEFNRRYLLDRYPDLPPRKVHVIHVGVPVEAYQKPVERRRLSTSIPRILCVAALKPYKGLPVLIQACRKLARSGVRFRCDIVGEGPARPDLERLILETGLGDQVRLLGALPEEEVARRLRETTIFALPSVVAADGQMEGIPVALMEAMAAGRPVVASNLSGIPELVEDEQSGFLVEPGDRDDLAAAIGALIDDPAGARSMGERAREKVRARFALRDVVAELRCLLDRHNPGLSLEVLDDDLFSDLRAGRVHLIRSSRDAQVAELVAEGVPRCVVKVHRARPGQSRPPVERARHERETLCRLHRDLDRAFGVPRPLRLESGGATVLMEACSGTSLERLVRQSRFAIDGERAEGLARALVRTGRWLRHFQDRTLGVDADTAAALEGVVERARHALMACGTTLSGRSTAVIREGLDRRARMLDPGSLRVVGHHGDFWPGNVLVDEETIRVVDFEGYRQGLPWEDAAYFRIHLELLHGHVLLRWRARSLWRAFLDGYASDPPVDLDGFELCLVGAALDLLSRAPDLGIESRHRRLLSSLVSGTIRR